MWSYMIGFGAYLWFGLVPQVGSLRPKKGHGASSLRKRRVKEQNWGEF